MRRQKKTRSVESDRRIRQLLEALRKPTQTQIQQLRAVHAMELAATPVSRRLLHHWSEGADGSRLSDAARAALQRRQAQKGNKIR
jgi:hypothetical protein